MTSSYRTSNLRDPKERQKGEIRIATLLAKQSVVALKIQLDFLILSTATGPERNKICDANIHAMEIQQLLESYQTPTT